MTEEMAQSYVTAAVWLLRNGHGDLARRLRDEMVNDVPEWASQMRAMWNEACDSLIDYGRRKMDHPEAMVPFYEELKFDVE